MAFGGGGGSFSFGNNNNTTSTGFGGGFGSTNNNTTGKPEPSRCPYLEILGGELELMRLTTAGFGATTTNATGFGSTATANPFSGGASGFGQNTGGTWEQ
jgi:hypothetical protein